jgi:cell division transport system permease protein
MNYGSFRRARGLAGVMLSSMLVVVLLGAATLLRENLLSQEQKFKADLRLEVFLRDDTNSDELRAVTSEIVSLTGYESHSYRDKTEAYNQMQASLGSQLLPSGGFNPFPNSFVVTFAAKSANYQNFQAAENRLKAIRCVESVRYPKATLISQENLFSFFAKAWLVLTLLASALLLAVMWLGLRKIALACREQTRVLVLLGAGWKEVGLPLLVKALLAGIVAAAAGLILLKALWVLSARFPLQLSFITGNGIATVVAFTVAAAMIAGALVAQRQLR